MKFHLFITLDLQPSKGKSNEDLIVWVLESFHNFCVGFGPGTTSKVELLDSFALARLSGRCERCRHAAHADLVCGFRSSPHDMACLCTAMDLPPKSARWWRRARSVCSLIACAWVTYAALVEIVRWLRS
jgi:hypothetical protein